MSKDDVKDLDQNERRLLVDLLFDHVVRDTRRIYREKKKKLLKILNERIYDDFVKTKQDMLADLERPVILSSDIFWELADHNGYQIWDYNREPQFWHLLFAVAAYEARHMQKESSSS